MPGQGNDDYYARMNEQPDEMDIFRSDLDTLNPNVWFNGIEAKLQHCLVKDNVSDGVLQYKMLISHLAILAISSNKMKEKEYEEEVAKIIEEKSKKHDEDDVKAMKEAMIRYGVIQKHILKVQSSKANLNYRPESSQES